ncbi:MAG: endonuclease/exonuclease/phosphatase family protein [Ilumatobacteraceae bacterium]
MARRRSLTIASVNVNGIRAADRNGISAWIADRRPDVVTLQEVRAPDDIFTEHVDRLWGEKWHRSKRPRWSRGRQLIQHCNFAN